MDSEKIKVTEDEVTVRISHSGDKVCHIVVSLIIVAAVSGFGGLTVVYQDMFTDNIHLIVGFFVGSFLPRLFFGAGKETLITVDRKHLIVYSNASPNVTGKQRVFKMSEIRNWTAAPNYRITTWKRIISFFGRNTTGSIAFNYGEAKLPVRTAYGMLTADAVDLLGVLQEKGWITGYNTSYEQLEYRTRKKVLTLALTCFLIFLSAFLLPLFIFKQKFHITHFGTEYILWLMLPFIVFCTVMLIITYRWQKQDRRREKISA